MAVPIAPNSMEEFMQKAHDFVGRAKAAGKEDPTAIANTLRFMLSLTQQNIANNQAMKMTPYQQAQIDLSQKSYDAGEIKTIKDAYGAERLVRIKPDGTVTDLTGNPVNNGAGPGDYFNQPGQAPGDIPGGNETKPASQPKNFTSVEDDKKYGILNTIKNSGGNQGPAPTASSKNYDDQAANWTSTNSSQQNYTPASGNVDLNQGNPLANLVPNLQSLSFGSNQSQGWNPYGV